MNSIEAFVKSYRAALNERDATRLAHHYGSPFMHMSWRHDRLAHGWRRNDAEFRAGLERALAFYASIGADSFDSVSVRETTPDPAHSVVKVVWGVTKSNRMRLMTLEVSYMLRRREPHRIVAFVDHHERRGLIEQGIAVSGKSLLFDLACNDEQKAERPTASGKIVVSELSRPLDYR